MELTPQLEDIAQTKDQRRGRKIPLGSIAARNTQNEERSTNNHSDHLPTGGNSALSQEKMPLNKYTRYAVKDNDIQLPLPFRRQSRESKVKEQNPGVPSREYFIENILSHDRAEDEKLLLRVHLTGYLISGASWRPVSALQSRKLVR